MGTVTGLAYWPADTSQPVLELTTGDLLRQAAGAAGHVVLRGLAGHGIRPSWHPTRWGDAAGQARAVMSRINCCWDVAG
jgi:hypothetical protein